MKLAALILIATFSTAALANNELSLNEQVQVDKIEMEATQSSNLKGLYKDFHFADNHEYETTLIVVAKSSK